MEDHVYPHMYEVENVHWWFVARQRILRRYIEVRLGLGEGARILDVGCGTGAVLESLSRRYDAYGTDTSPQAIEFCRRRGLTKLHLGSLDTFPPGPPFDLITMLDVVEHVEDDRGLLRTASNLLRTGGHVLIAVPAFPSLWSAHDEMLHHKRRYTRASLRTTVTDAGFMIAHLTFFNTLLFPAAFLARAVARLTGSARTHDLEIPPRGINALLTRVFSMERPILARSSLPIGLSLLCLAARNNA
jgi:2-polyprenyl-3-methyl-5-hydroxy-6-metoxy-1,4-benzoquinol methylase